ncbi:putative LRR receptor-like serine/threonine-protein kinase [Acorus calamus]|uniref:non-specific serine/threonine protein kinase n=1 Tax=Acorus calamus TaxID=4465 RepID=A0AAV9DUC4_ACOCL|nr:putative LRR receptor-like serine/threonine-protein kinase [Acorus calamus]
MPWWGDLDAQTTTLDAQTTTNPSEARALNTIFQRFGISATSSWNKTGDPCSGGIASDNVTDIDDQRLNPGIKCDCTNQTNCHIIRLKIYALNVVGPFPNEIATFTNLIFLKLDQNYLTGTVPKFIGNLTNLVVLSIALNAFTGPIPKEIGLLNKLTVLSFGHNNFTGSLPPELGNLVVLEQAYINSCGALSGEIPSSFANLKKLQTLWAMDNNFTGKLPDFIGNWTSLKDLRFEGNSFQGPIPSSFSSLTNMSNLRITDLAGGSSSSFDFIKNMKSLSTLILRNNKISGSLPSNMDEYQQLNLLDLSFNNLTGPIPLSLFNSSSLNFLFLGNNSISGSLPSEKNSNLQTIDLSYNQLSGSFPPWVNTSGLQLNLVANNFVIDESNNSVFPSDLNCLQRNIPCLRGSPRYYTFAINCGGKAMTTSDQTSFDNETENLGAASYYVTNTQRWAVSSIGSYIDGPNKTYIVSSLSQFTNTLDSELFQSARQSPSSLRYYGLGLQNGNYTVRLQFAETLFDDSTKWTSLGRRVFDIYIQGNRVLKDFDIRKEAGGSFKAIKKEFIASVPNNFLEIHLFWAGKGTCCIPYQGLHGPMISAISASPQDFKGTVSNVPPTTPSTKKAKTSLVIGIIVPIGILALVLLFGVFMWRRKQRRLRTAEDEELLGTGARPNTFSYAELRTATEDFNNSNKLGEGGFGQVYKGKLADGREVAVKQLSVTSHQGKRQFVTEIAMISAVQHRNLVKLYGCCIEGNRRVLVYEYLVNKSLDQALFGESSLQLDWPTRFGICLGTARGLAYLHEESRVRIVHRDVKASNILLDADLNPKISDFGLAKLYDDKKTHLSTRVAGTYGYLAPEYALWGHLTEKVDVFGFGVVALEIISGRQNCDMSLDKDKVYLLEWAWQLHEENQDFELVDKTLSKFDKEEAIRVIVVALLCTQASPSLRPSMSRVMGMLSGDLELGNVTTRPGYLTDWRLNNFSSLMDDSRGGDTMDATPSTTTATTSRSGLTPGMSFLPVSPTVPIMNGDNK